MVTICQFRDNILVASDFPDGAHEQLISGICKLPGQAWGLRVLCECDETCTHTCHQSTVTAVGICMVRGPKGEGMAYLHPYSLDHNWNLKQGPPLKSPLAQHPGYVSSIITGALAASNPWCLTWASQLLSVGAWCQVAVLSGYDSKQGTMWAHSAITKTYSVTPHASQDTGGFVHQQIQFFPHRRCCHVSAVLHWLLKNAYWRGSQYFVWELPA